MLKKKLGAEALELNWSWEKNLTNHFKIPSTLTIIEGCKWIGSSVFWECWWLKKVIIPESVEYIGFYAFKGCQKLKEVIIPKNVEEIRDYAFWDCGSLKEVVIPDGVKKIEGFIFCDCIGLEKVIVPKSVKLIGICAFDGCNNATIILKKRKKNFEFIASDAFRGCKHVKEKIRS